MNTSEQSQMSSSDIISFLGCFADRFGALRVLLDAIATRAEAASDLRLLAIAGKDIAFDNENAAGSLQEQLEQAGFRQ